MSLARPGGQRGADREGVVDSSWLAVPPVADVARDFTTEEVVRLFTGAIRVP
jgi:hypothetical protein